MLGRKSVRYGSYLANRLEHLEGHLRAENPTFMEILPTYYELDRQLYRMGILERDSSLATRISWWPLISVLGTFSAGKSSFINAYLGEDLQRTGNQAVDDRFTVICYRDVGQEQNRTLPGTALDADPRFPFYRMSREIDKVAEGEGKHIEGYLQLTTCAQERIKGKILIDSPGFDADDQRRSILRITEHIVDLSDLVLVFFDARHPEPGAMQDTLQHLVAKTVARTDASKVLYVLNQIDTSAREDNPEEVIAAWQRAIAQAGLTSGRFYCIYNEKSAVPFEDAAQQARFRAKKDEDLAQIYARMEGVEVQRSYRIVGLIDVVIGELEAEIVPAIITNMRRWRQGVLIADTLGLIVGLGIVWLAVATFGFSLPEGVGLFDWLAANLSQLGYVAGAFFVVALVFHFTMRDMIGKRIAAKIPDSLGQAELNPRRAFLRNTRFWVSIFAKTPAGWGRRALVRIQNIREKAAAHTQRLNDRYADPSGRREATAKTAASDITEVSGEIPGETEPDQTELTAPDWEASREEPSETSKDVR